MLICFLSSLFMVAGAYAVLYVFHSIGLSRMLKNTGFRKPWFAYLPFFRVFAIGCLADQHADIFPPKKRGQKLLYLAVASFLLTAIYNIAYWSIVIPILKETFAEFWHVSIIEIDSEALATALENLTEAVGSAGNTQISILYYLSNFALIAYSVYKITVLIRVYSIFARKKALLLTLLSVFLEESTGIIFFVIRNNPPKNLRWQTADEPQMPNL